MRFLSLRLRVVLIMIALGVFNFAEAWGAADWRLYFATEFREYYYDKASLPRSTGDLLRVSTKTVFYEKGVKELRDLGIQPRSVDYSVSSTEVTCAGKTVNILSITYYSKDGTIIKSVSKPGMEFIKPGTHWDALHKQLCKP